MRDKLAADLGREVLLISAVTGQGLQLVVGRVTQMIADLSREEAAAARKKPMQYPTEAAIRTEDFQISPVASITPPAGGDTP